MKSFLVILLVLFPSTLGFAPETSVAPPEIKAAMLKAGPEYSYRLLYDGTLQVNRGDGWLRLRYKETANENNKF